LTSKKKYQLVKKLKYKDIKHDNEINIQGKMVAGWFEEVCSLFYLIYRYGSFLPKKKNEHLA
jgi:hypothetical protein